MEIQEVQPAEIVLRIDEKLKSLNLRRLDVTDCIGVSVQSLTDMKKKGSMPRADTMLKMAHFLGVSVEWLLTGKETKGKIPLLRQTVACGSGQEWHSDDNIEEYLDPVGLHTDKKLFAFRARGISMVGVGIQDGDILVFDGSTAQSFSDNVYVFALDGRVFCKFLRFDSLKKEISVFSVQRHDIKEAELVRVISDDMIDFHIFGRVLYWIHENRLMYC